MKSYRDDVLHKTVPGDDRPTESVPDAPESLPNYLAEGLPKQDDATLADVQEYVDALLACRDGEVDPGELPDDAEPFDGDEVPDGVDPALVESYREEHPGRTGGHFALERVRCGADCTHNDGRGHGPYVYHYHYEDGRLRSAYVGKPDDGG